MNCFTFYDEMRRLNPKKVILFILAMSCLSFLKESCAQESIIDQIMRTQPAIVTVKATNHDIYQSSSQKAAINPKTGQLVKLRKLFGPTYNRVGAGVIIHPDGIIVTNSHIVYRANTIKITLHDGTTVNAQALKVVGGLDLAFLKIDPPYPLARVPIADSNQVRLGDGIITVGNSAVLNQTISGGHIKGIGTRRAEMDNTELLQTTINLYEGDSGGPLFDRRGRLIGLMTAKETAADRSSFAIPSNRILEYLLKTIEELK